MLIVGMRGALGQAQEKHVDIFGRAAGRCLRYEVQKPRAGLPWAFGLVFVNCRSKRRPVVAKNKLIAIERTSR